MDTYVHPVSGAEIRGMRLAPGAKIQSSDFYDCSDGKWSECSSTFVGQTIEQGNEVIWVRPDTELSIVGLVILTYLSTNNLLLTRLEHWKAIPSPEWRYDGRMDWRIQYPECIHDLIDFGYIEAVPVTEIDCVVDFDGLTHTPQENQIFRVSEKGQERVRLATKKHASD